jgi:hypothetical protein
VSHSTFAYDLFCALSLGLIFISNTNPSRSCVYICKFQLRPIHPPSRRLSNLNPNSIAQVVIFAAVCEGFLGIDPHWDLWTHLFSVEPFALTMGEKRVRMAVRAGGCILQLRQACAQQYIPAILVSSNKGWQRRWFYLRNDDGRLPSFSQ